MCCCQLIEQKKFKHFSKIVFHQNLFKSISTCSHKKKTKFILDKETTADFDQNLCYVKMPKFKITTLFPLLKESAGEKKASFSSP